MCGYRWLLGYCLLMLMVPEFSLVMSVISTAENTGLEMAFIDPNKG